jgi:drug/metabolite transporter (DMT)-like permease
VNAAGLASGVASALAFAFYTVWGRALPRDLSPWTVLLWSFVAGALLWLPLAPPWALLATPLPGPVWAGIGVVTVFGTLVPFGLYLAGLRRIGPAHASVTSTLEPVLSGAAAFLVLGESLGPVQLAGGALVLGGLVLLHARR